MRGITVVVIALGVLILVMTAVVIATIAGRLAHGPAHPTPTLGAASVEIPRGARVSAMTTGGDRLVLALTLASGSQQLLVIDLTTGTRLGTVELHEQP